MITLRNPSLSRFGLVVAIVLFTASCDSCLLTPHELHRVGPPGSQSCLTDDDCPPDRACEAEQCTLICDAGSQCEAGGACLEGMNTEQRICREPRDAGATSSGRSCLTDDDCPNSEACEAERCTLTCEGDADCEDGESCRQGDNTSQTICRERLDAG